MKHISVTDIENRLKLPRDVARPYFKFVFDQSVFRAWIKITLFVVWAFDCEQIHRAERSCQNLIEHFQTQVICYVQLFDFVKLDVLLAEI